MSFWDQNKDTFKSAGKATLKGVGHGTKALSSAGYRTYKNHSGNSSSEKEPVEYVPGSVPSLTKEQLHAMPAPPRRGQSQPQSQSQPQNQPQIQPQPQPQNHPPQYQPQGQPQYGQPQTQYQPNAAQNTSAQAAPAQTVPAQTASAQTAPASSLPNLFQQSAPHLQTLGNLASNPHVQQLYHQVNNQVSAHNSGAQNQQIPSYQQATATPPGVPPRNPGAQNTGAQNTPAQPMPHNPAAYAPPLPEGTPYGANSASTASPNPAPYVSSAGSASTEKETPKNPTDISMLTPPPIHKNRAPSSASSNTPSKYVSPSAPHLPSRSSAGEVQDAQASLTPESVPPNYSSGTQPKFRGGPNKSGVYECPPVRYTELDLTQVGPPPPRRHDSKAHEISSSSEIQPKLIQRESSHTSPPPPPPRSGSATSASGISTASVSASASADKPKKVPPPKPKKLSAIAVNATGTSICEHVSEPDTTEVEQLEPRMSEQRGQVNFAAEIANLRLGKVTAQSFSTSPEPVNVKSPPPKPVKLQTLSKTPHFDSKLVGEKVVENSGNVPLKHIKPTIANKPDTPAKFMAAELEDLNSSSSVSPPPVPAPRRYRREAVPLPVAVPENLTESESEKAPESSTDGNTKDNSKIPDRGIDLELDSGWYGEDMDWKNLPESFVGLSCQTEFQNIASTFYKRSIEMVLHDLSRVKYLISWKGYDYANASAKEVKFSPSPITSKVPTREVAIENSKTIGASVVKWCQEKLGQLVSRGECWDLAHDALKSVPEGAFVSMYFHHGYPFLEISGTPEGILVIKWPMDLIRPGDILQFKSAVFKDPETGSEVTAGLPDHTAVVESADLDSITVLEANTDDTKVVKRGSYSPKHLASGSMTVYRPMPKSWGE